MNQFSRFWQNAEYALGRRTVYIVVALILVRLISLGFYPLMDTTEGRYGEMARKMAEMNDWITPWFDTGIPFWGKPPLSFWMSAVGIKLFGVNEFAVRIPHFLAATLVVAICYDWAKRSLINPFYVIVILITSFLFLITSGAVLTDMALCVGSTLSLRGFWLSLRGLQATKKSEQWLFFIGLSVMLLAKGPVGWVLVLFPISLWALFTGSIKETWQGLPWIKGSILAMLVVLPWYLIAEQHTPGFLHYFFVGEHWQRFTVPGWKGDLYGNAHETPKGTIWLQLIYGALPWSLMLPIIAWFYRQALFGKNKRTILPQHSQLSLYLLLTGLAPCLFFTMSGNILWTYILPGLPTLALCLALWLDKGKPLLAKRILLAGSLISLMILTGVLSALILGNKADERSAKSVVALYDAQKNPLPFVFLNDRPYSAKFYSQGKAINIDNLQEAAEIGKNQPIYLAVRKTQLPLFEKQLAGFKVIGDAGNYRLYLK